MKYRYGKVDSQTIEELRSIVGRGNVTADKSEMEGYSYDEAPLAKRHFPQVVVKPADVESIARVLALANENRIPVTPRGAGTGLSGGCIPVCGGVVLSLERMNRVLEIDEGNFVATVEAGVTLSDLYQQVEARGFTYPLYPGEMEATIGGNVATNAGGMNAVKYGVTRHHVLGLEAVLPNGEVVQTGGEYVKSTTGYDLTQLIIGSEGTLAVVTKVILKLATKPARREVLFVPFNNLRDAIDSVPEILRLRMTPIGIEFMERGIVEVAEKYLGRELPYHQYEAFLMIIMDGESEDEIHEYFARVEEICKRHGAAATLVPGSERARRRLLDAREKFYHAIKRFARLQIIDVVVPISRIAEFVTRVKEISKEYGVPVIAYGHAGDGNVHLHPICQDMSQEEWDRRLPQLMGEIYRAGISFGGAISGEHGIGFDKKAYLPIQMDTALLNIMKRLKRSFDPNNILNPGKIFDLEV